MDWGKLRLVESVDSRTLLRLPRPKRRTSTELDESRGMNSWVMVELRYSGMGSRGKGEDGGYAVKKRRERMK